MSQEKWTVVDRYYSDLLVAADPALEAALQDSASAGLPPINVTATQGKFLHLLARIHAARHILEIGTLGGYSTIWLARALPSGGRLTTLELNANCAAVAGKNFERAGIAGVVDLRVGRALDTLPLLAAEGRRPFDLIFIDADKQSTADYFLWALKLSRTGTVIVVDNVVRNGAVAESNNDDPGVRGIRRFNELLASETKVTATAIQTVGSKGYDGFTLALVTG